MSQTEEPRRKRLLFVGGEPVSMLLMERLGLNCWAAAIVVLVVLGVPMYTVVTLKSLWIGENCLLTDFGWWWLQFVSSPAALVFLFWMPAGIRGILEGLREKGVILVLPRPQGAGDDYVDFANDFDRSYTHPVWSVTSLAISALFVFMVLRKWMEPLEGWQGGRGPLGEGFTFWYNLFYFLVIYYFWFLLALRGTIAVIWLNRFLRRFDIQVKGLDPDKAGGFSPLGRIMPRVGILVAIVGVTLGLLVVDAQIRRGLSFQETAREPGFFLLVAVYVVLAPTLFYALMGTAHSVMKRYRDRRLQQISQKFESRYSMADAELASASENQEVGFDGLGQIVSLHAVISAFPVWPVDTRGAAQFFTLVLAPLLVSIFLALLEPLMP